MKKSKAEYTAEYRLKSYKKNLELVKKFYGFPFKCSNCDFTSEVFAPFDMHHVNPDDKEGTPFQLFKTSSGKFETEMKKCILLCANCHRLHHHGDIELKKQSIGIEVVFETRLTDDQIEAIKKAFLTTQLSQQEIADIVGVNVNTIWRHTKTLSRTLKGKHSGRPSSNRQLDKATVLLIKEETTKDRTNKSIATEFNVSEHTVANIKNGVAYADYLAEDSLTSESS